MRRNWWPGCSHPDPHHVSHHSEPNRQLLKDNAHSFRRLKLSFKHRSKYDYNHSFKDDDFKDGFKDDFDDGSKLGFKHRSKHSYNHGLKHRPRGTSANWRPI